MTSDAIGQLEQYMRIGVTLSPLLLLGLKSVRRLLGQATAWAWGPVARQFAARDALLRAIQEDVGAMRQQMSVVVGTMRLQADNAEDIGFFECDESGRNTYVNRTYCRWLHCDATDLLDWGFLGFTHPADRESVRAEWLACLRDHRDYRARVRMGTPQHGWRDYDVVARPIPESPPAVAWAGTIRPLGRRADDAERWHGDESVA